MLKSSICNQKQLESKIFQDWATHFGEAPGHMHRKIWEWCFISEALNERSLLKSGKKGLGFAVGEEPLASVYCDRGASICATDLFHGEAEDIGWVETGQHATGLEKLNERGLCSESTLKKLCSFRYVDMNQIPDDLTGFDFVWSACALEHLGSIKHGADFIYNAMHCLKPGGFAVHTTEYNFSSNENTVETGGTVLYRRKDIEEIARTLRKQGHKINVSYQGGDHPNDTFIDVPPYKQNPHLKLELASFVITSIGLIIQKSTD